MEIKANVEITLEVLGGEKPTDELLRSALNYLTGPLEHPDIDAEVKVIKLLKTFGGVADRSKGYERLCEECGAPMKKRVNRTTGEPFWGCSSYPKCKHTEQVSPGED